MMGQMGGILTADDFKEIGFPIPAPSPEVKGNWGEIMGSFLVMKNTLATVRHPNNWLRFRFPWTIYSKNWYSWEKARAWGWYRNGWGNGF